MLEQITTTDQTGLKLLGEFQQFAEQLGGVPGLAPFAPPLCLSPGRVGDLPSLREFLQIYCQQILIGCEFPSIFEAYGHASRSELRELIATDLQVGREPNFQAFAGASQYVGTAQLKRLRPLRDQRLVQRYLGAVERGEAFGWHSVVYGLILAVYSLPLRPGLLSYGQQTVQGLIKCAAFSCHLPPEQSWQLHQEICAPLASAVEAIVKHSPPQSVPAS